MVASGMGGTHRRRGPRTRPAADAARLRIDVGRPRSRRRAAGAVRSLDVVVAPCRGRSRRGRDRDDVRPRLDRRSARRPAHRGTGDGDARRNDVEHRPTSSPPCRRISSRSPSRRSRSPRSWPAASRSTCHGCSRPSRQRATTSSTCTACWPPRCRSDRSIVCSGPGTRAIGMNSGGNALGQGNRANLTIGRALQLVVRNFGGGRPGEVDRAAHGKPGQDQLLLRRGRRHLAVRHARCRARHRAGVDALTRVRRGGPAGLRRPALPRTRVDWRASFAMRAASGPAPEADHDVRHDRRDGPRTRPRASPTPAGTASGSSREVADTSRSTGCRYSSGCRTASRRACPRRSPTPSRCRSSDPVA